MKTARMISAAVVLFLLFGLPAMLFVQFSRVQKASSPDMGHSMAPGFLSGLLGRFSSAAFRDSAPNGSPGSGRTGPKTTPPEAASASGPSGTHGHIPRAAGQTSAEGGAFADDTRPNMSGRPDNAGMEELEGRPLNDPRLAYQGAGGGSSAGGQDLGSGQTARQGSRGEASYGQQGRGMRAVSGNSIHGEDMEHGRSQERAQTTRIELTTDQLTGENQANLIKASMESNQAVNMTKKLHLLDGAKDFAGRNFDGNTKLRKSIPLGKYTDAFGHKAIRAKEDPPVDLSP